MAIDLETPHIRAPFDGLVDDRFVDVGDYMRPGDKCALLIAPEPFLAVGAASERDVAKIRVGNAATARLVTGETVEGRVASSPRAPTTPRAPSASKSNFPIPTASCASASRRHPHPRPPAHGAENLAGHPVLDDNGVYGVRAVEHGIVRFFPVQIVSDGPDGVWVSGLPDHLAAVFVGQSFVTDGDT